MIKYTKPEVVIATGPVATVIFTGALSGGNTIPIGTKLADVQQVVEATTALNFRKNNKFVSRSMPITEDCTIVATIRN